MLRLKLSKLLAVISVLALISIFIPTALPAFALDTGYRSPTAQAPGPGGDGNGFETNPTNAFASDGLFAVDSLSGTSSSSACTSTARDKQDYFNYGFSVPAGSTINGVEVRLDAKVNSVGNEAPALCVQLSTDGGTTWTTTKQTPTLTTTSATYILGGATDLWGRSWASTDFADTNFRVRLITIAFSNQRTFSLDWAPVKVYYTSSGPTPTNTAVPPTNTAGPTATAAPPTNTPTKTNTPLPTNTPTPGPSATPTKTPTKTNTPAPTNTPGSGSNPIGIYGIWHCSNDACLWGAVRDMTNFDQINHWIIDRGDGSGLASTNVVIMSFVQPLKLLNQTNDAGDVNGVPVGMNSAVVNYFKSHNVRVMASIGGITYVSPWDTALNQNATQLGLNAAAMATNLGIGMEIDWEENSPTTAEMSEMQAFINAYRSVHPYDPTGNDPTARLTIDVAAGDRWLVTLDQKATADWLKTSDTTVAPVLDYANAMVANGDGTPTDWQQHVSGYPTLGIGPLAPAKLTGSLWMHGNSASCNNFAGSPQNADANYVETVKANGAGITPGMLGFMFWAGECEGTKTTCTTPPNTCELGMGVAAKTFNIPLPLPALRQQ